MFFTKQVILPEAIAEIFGILSFTFTSTFLADVQPLAGLEIFKV
jgi:hypothetical protein